jgi:hypothetical protein
VFIFVYTYVIASEHEKSIKVDTSIIVRTRIPNIHRTMVGGIFSMFGLLVRVIVRYLGYNAFAVGSSACI